MLLTQADALFRDSKYAEAAPRYRRAAAPEHFTRAVSLLKAAGMPDWDATDFAELEALLQQLTKSTRNSGYGAFLSSCSTSWRKVGPV